MNITKKDYFPAERNCAQTDTSVSFDPQLPLGRELVGTADPMTGEIVQPGVMLLEDGKMRLSFQGPEVHQVEVCVNGEKHSMHKGQDGMWTIDLSTGVGGFCSITFLVDGAEVLNPLAPIGFGGSRPINYVDIPQAGVDFYLCKDVPHGAVAQEYYWSEATGCMKSCLVYTPAGYQKETDRDYPVLYLQHGHGENERCWLHQGRMNFILDNLIEEGKCKPCIVVMNNGMTQKVEDGLRVLDTSKLEELLIKDCIPFIESHYRVKTDKWSRAMAGLSMGSMQTSITTLKHPELFGYAGIFSGFVTRSNSLVYDTSHLKELEDKEKFQRDFKVFFRACGDTDYVALERFQSDTKMFEEKGLSPAECPSHVEKYYTGAHEWNVWRMCLRDFLPLIF